ncbi:uncharacterized protein Z518_08811 [Rhinocladiella mackenziei CBS 650.93]|uniref:Uncharacterized protein n=1 Tax=Rhinocladiella mackenziei CBS 650.93 TaxID=1442369 RepID=A0A0D2GXG1_9EURO|nr:uncharacterized protein Z518_08811 [Rhinocladiella mackenziei CBS 650.93]KIX02868.1 hypothetical protein Z518_08811 [Rhinocladiella mackenziei CBS 650.93]
MPLNRLQPIAKREEFTHYLLLADKILTIISQLVPVSVGASYTFSRPEDCKY